MEINKVHHLDWLNNEIADRSVNLFLADPPYYKKKGDFDFIWPDFDSYLKDVERWAIEAKRVLSENGTLLWYGDRKNIAYTQVILDQYFNLESNVVIRFTDRQTQKIKADDARCFINVTERLLMYSNGEDITGMAFVEKEYVAPRNPFAIELRKAIERQKISMKDIAEFGGFYANVNHGGMVANWCNGYNIPSRIQWDKMTEILPLSDHSYEVLKAKYENNRRPFNPYDQFKYDVIEVSQESSTTGKYDHDTVKPEKLTRILINTCSRPGDLIMVPFAGSGTECSMAIKDGRNFIGFDIDAKHVKTANKRVNKTLRTPFLFV